MNKIISTGLTVLGCIYTISVCAEERWTNGVAIEFRVNIEAPACTVEYGLGQITGGDLDFGTISGKDGSIGHRLPLLFRFSGCNNVNVVDTIAYTTDVTQTQYEKGSPEKGFISTNRERVRLYLLQSITGNDKFISKNFSTPIPSNGAATVTVCYIEPRIVGGDAMAQGYEGSASFTITYL